MSDTFQVVPDSLEAIPGIIAELDASFDSGKTLSIEWRKEQLRSLWKMIDENEADIEEAIVKDIGKPSVQIHVLEFIMVKNDILHCLDRLDKWLEVEAADCPPPFENWSPKLHRRPKGTCLVIGAWNYPITLTLVPFIGVIACGNTGVLKPSELAPHTADILARLLPNYLDRTCFKVVNGSTSVGRLVMKAAAEHLTPVTLELGGSNAVVVTENANVELAATRIAWAKFAIAGQTCFAPNHVIVHECVYDTFVAALRKVYASYYGEKAHVEKVGKIVNNAHWKRLVGLIASTKGKIIVGGTGDEMARFIEPTIIIDVPEEDPVVQTEIFGPIFPVMKYSSTSDRARLLQKLSPDALALYVFTEDLEEADLIVKTTTTGTASINDCMAQIAPTSLQFGGFGKSGTGAYRGKASIDTFSHKQATVTVPTSPEFEELLGWRYPYAESTKTVGFVKKNLEGKLS